MGLRKFKNPMESNGWKILPISHIPDKVKYDFSIS